MTVMTMLLAPKTVGYFKNAVILFGVVTVAEWWR
jgi:hypothetical protein